MKINWTVRNFEELTTKELYALIQLRLEIFVVEQNCPYQDVDGKDYKALHLMGWNEKNELIAYLRILPANITYKEISIGRVVSSAKIRRTGAGKMLMQKSLEVIKEKFGNVPVRISAQLYLKKFYENFGFTQVSAEYLEDNIPHVEMLLN